MLVLSRHRDEKIVIASNIVLTVLGIHGDTVRLGIQAPLDIPIVRGERMPPSPEKQSCPPPK